MKRNILFAVLAVFVLQSFAQFTIKGKVMSHDLKEPLSGAHIILENTQLRTITGSKGEFQFGKLKSGSYTLIISYLGYATEMRKVALHSDSNIQIELLPSAFMADEIIIRSTRVDSKAPITFQDISHTEIMASNQGKDLPMLLSGSVSATTTSDAGNGIGYTALRIRGTDMTRINVTINGIPLNDPESHNVFWVDLPDFAASTDNIQIQRGVGTSTNGAAAFGASINLLSSPIPTEPFGEISGALGSYQSSRLSGSFGTGLINKHWSFSGRISDVRSDGFIDRASSNLQSYHIGGSYSDKLSSLRFNLVSGKETTYQAWDGIPGYILDTNRRFNGMGAYLDANGKLQYYENETDNYKQTHYQLLYSRQLNKSLFLNAAAHYSKGKGYYEQFRESDDLIDYGIQPIHLPGPYLVQQGDTLYFPDSLVSNADLIRRKWLDNDFAGITYSLSWKSGPLQTSVGGSWNIYIGRHFGRVIWSEIALAAPPDVEWYRSKAQKQDFNIYGKANYNLSQVFSLFADMQMRRIIYGIDGIDDDSRDITQEHNFTFFNPKAGITATIDENNAAYLSFGIANREPNRDNFVDADLSETAPRPETLYDFEIGHKYQSAHVLLNSNLYWMLYNDQLVLTGAINDVGAPVMVNVPESYRLGLEVSGKIEFTDKLNWGLSATISRNKIRKFTEYVDNWDTWSQESFEHQNTDLSFSPSLILNSDVQLKPLKNLSIHFISKHVGKQYLDNTQDESRKLDAYLINDLRFSYSFFPAFLKELRINAFINNIFNHEYESNAWIYRYMEADEMKVLDGYYPQVGINFMAGMSLKF